MAPRLIVNPKEWDQQFRRQFRSRGGFYGAAVCLFVLASLLVFCSTFGPVPTQAEPLPRLLQLALDTEGLGFFCVYIFLRRAYSGGPRLVQALLALVMGVHTLHRLLLWVLKEHIPLPNHLGFLLTSVLLPFSLETKTDDEDTTTGLDIDAPKRLLVTLLKNGAFLGLCVFISTKIAPDSTDLTCSASEHRQDIMNLCLWVGLFFVNTVIGCLLVYLPWRAVLLAVNPDPSERTPRRAPFTVFLYLFPIAFLVAQQGLVSDIFVVFSFVGWFIFAFFYSTPSPAFTVEKSDDDNNGEFCRAMGAGMLLLCLTKGTYVQRLGLQEATSLRSWLWLLASAAGSLACLFRRPPPRPVIIATIACLLTVKPLMEIFELLGNLTGRFFLQ